MISYPKIMILSDGTPETTKVFLAGQQVECAHCYFSVFKPIKAPDYQPEHSISFDVTITSDSGDGESVSTTYRLYKTSKGELRFQKLIPVKES